MKEREKELNKDIKKNPLDWVVFKIHGLTSNHSQSWLLPLFWMIILTFFVGEFSSLPHAYPLWNVSISFILVILLLIVALLLSEITNTMLLMSIVIISYFAYGLSLGDWTLSKFISLLNPFTKAAWKNISVGIFIYKITVMYLVYQFVTAIRQNTRRK